MSKESILKGLVAVVAFVGAVWAARVISEPAPTPPVVDLPQQEEDVVVQQEPMKIEFRKARKITVEPTQMIYFDTEVNQSTVDITMQLMNELSNFRKPLYLMLKSPGGSVLDGMRLIAYMDNSRVPIYTVCVDICASMAAHIHQAGVKRYIESSGLLMFHPASGMVQGQIEGMVAELNEIKKITDKLDERAIMRSGMSKEAFREPKAYGMWLDRDDAITAGFADELVYVSTRSGPVTGISVSAILEKMNPKMFEEIKKRQIDNAKIYLWNELENE